MGRDDSFRKPSIKYRFTGKGKGVLLAGVRYKSRVTPKRYTSQVKETCDGWLARGVANWYQHIVSILQSVVFAKILYCRSTRHLFQNTALYGSTN